MNDNIDLTHHQIIRNELLNNREALVSNFKIIIDSNITDIVFINELIIKNHRIDSLILTNTGQLLILEIKSATDKVSLRSAAAQLNDYKNKLKLFSYYDLFAVLNNNSTKLQEFIKINNITPTMLRDVFNRINDYYTICISKNIDNYKLNYYKEAFKNSTNSFIILLNNNGIFTFQFNVERININNKSIEDELKILLNNALIKMKKDYFDSFENTIIELTSRILSLQSLNSDTISYTRLIIDTLNNNFAEKKIQSKSTNDDIYPKNPNVSDEDIEELRNKLIEQYKNNSPISIRNFIKLISNNPLLPGWNKIFTYFNTTSVQKILNANGLITPLKNANKYDNKTIENKRSFILNKIAEIYANNNNKITENLLLKNNLHPNTIRHYFDSIYEAYELAGVKPKYSKPKHLTKSEFIACFTELIPIFKENDIPFTARQLKKHGLSFYNIKKYFGSLKNLLKEFNISS